MILHGTNSIVNWPAMHLCTMAITTHSWESSQKNLIICYFMYSSVQLMNMSALLKHGTSIGAFGSYWTETPPPSQFTSSILSQCTSMFTPSLILCRFTSSAPLSIPGPHVTNMVTRLSYYFRSFFVQQSVPAAEHAQPRNDSAEVQQKVVVTSKPKLCVRNVNKKLKRSELLHKATSGLKQQYQFRERS